MSKFDTMKKTESKPKEFVKHIGKSQRNSGNEDIRTSRHHNWTLDGMHPLWLRREKLRGP